MDQAWRIGKLDRKSQHVQPTVLGMLNRQTHLLMLCLWIVKHLTDIEHAPARDTRFIELGNPMRDGLLPNLFVQSRIDRLAIGKA